MPHRAATRGRILKVAMRRFSEKGYNRTTMEEIADAASCNESTLADLYPCKADLFTASLWAADTERRKSSVAEILRQEPDFMVAMHKMASSTFDLYDRNYSRLRMFCYLERPDIMREFFEQVYLPGYIAIRDRIKKERTNGVVRKDVHPETAATGLIFQLAWRRIFEMLVVGAPFDGLKLSRGDIRRFVDIWLCGVMSNKSEISTELHGGSIVNSM